MSYRRSSVSANDAGGAASSRPAFAAAIRRKYRRSSGEARSMRGALPPRRDRTSAGEAGAMAAAQSRARGMRRPVSTDSKAASAIARARAPSAPVGEGSATPSSTSTKWSHSAR